MCVINHQNIILIYGMGCHFRYNGAVTLHDDDGNTFKVNGQILKVFLEQEIPELEEVDVFELSEI